MNYTEKILITIGVVALFVGLAWLSINNEWEPLYIISILGLVYALIVTWGLQPRITENCEKCNKKTPYNELLSNSKYGSYEFKEICDSCAIRYDRMNDEYQQEK